MDKELPTDPMAGIQNHQARVQRAPYPKDCIYDSYEPRDSGYFHWSAQWPTEDLDCGYPLLKRTEWIELTNGKYGNFNGHNTTSSFDGHVFITHTNHRFALENMSGQRVLCWIYRTGDPWERSSVNCPNKGETIELFPPPDIVNERKFDDQSRYCGNAKLRQLEDGTIVAIAGVFTITSGNEFNPTGRVNQWHSICTLARTIGVEGDLGEIKIIACDHEERLAMAQQEGYLQYESAYQNPGFEKLNLNLQVSSSGIVQPEAKQKTANGQVTCEIYTDWLEEGSTAIALGRGENASGNFRCYTSLSHDKGESWEAFQPTNIPSGENTVSLSKLPDGRWMIVGTFGDCWQRERRPLCIAIADDGRNFSKVFRLSGTEHLYQMSHAVFDGEHMYIVGPFKSNRDHTNFNSGRGEQFILRLGLDRLP